jgi:hypothetical protein
MVTSQQIETSDTISVSNTEAVDFDTAIENFFGNIAATAEQNTGKSILANDSTTDEVVNLDNILQPSITNATPTYPYSGNNVGNISQTPGTSAHAIQKDPSDYAGITVHGKVICYLLVHILN